MKDIIKKISTNKNTLYVVVIASIIQILYYISWNKLSAIIFFILISLLVHHFEKNMVIVLLSGIIASIIYNNGSSWIKEGFEEKEKEKKKRNVDINPEDTIEEVPDETDSALLTSVESNVQNSEPFKGKKKTAGGSRIDYASTLESAYENLDKMLGKEGISNLTNDTHKLMKQQKELFDSMKGMMPVLDKAKDMLKGFDLKSLGNMANKLTK
jgi:hypothetical protein